MRIKSLLVPTLATIVVAAAALALSSGNGARSSSASAPSSSTASGKTARVAIAKFAFGPQTLTVKAGTVVTFTNTDSTAHTATASGGFDTGTLNNGQSAHVTLGKPGTYMYICQFHAFMSGTIKVAG